MAHSSVDAKVVLLGTTGVGKSSLGIRFVEGNFDGSVMSTVGAHFISKTVTFDDAAVRLNIWDTSGQERYRSLIKGFYRNAEVAILVVDVTSKDSLDALDHWVGELQQNTQSMPILAIACNKVDLGDRRAIDMPSVLRYAEKVGARIVMDTSAKDGTNVASLFRNVAQLVIAPASTPRGVAGSRQSGDGQVVLGDEKRAGGKGGCC